MNTLENEKMYQKYLRHQKGLALLWFWMEQWKDLRGWEWENGSELCLSPLVSQRFIMGAPRPGRGVKSSNPFLGVQSDEGAWFKRIEWARCVWDENDRRLWFVSVTQKSPDLAWSDLPPIALGLDVDCIAQLQNWRGPRIDVRGVWWDEVNNFHVDSAPVSTMGVAVGSLTNNWSKNERQSVESLRDVVLNRLEQSNVSFNPGFARGEALQISGEYADFLRPYEKKPETSPIEFNYPEMFGQFYEGEQPPNSKKK